MCRAFSLSWTALYVNDDPTVLQPDFTKFRDMRTQSSEFMMSSNDNLSENGISVCKAIKDIYGIDSCDGLKIMLSTCPMLIRGLRSPGYGCDELLAPAPMAITYGNGVCHLFVGALGSSDSILGRGVFQYTRSGMSFQNEFELQETLGYLPGLSSSILPYYLMNSDFIPLLNGKALVADGFSSAAGSSGRSRMPIGHYEITYPSVYQFSDQVNDFGTPALEMRSTAMCRSLLLDALIETETSLLWRVHDCPDGRCAQAGDRSELYAAGMSVVSVERASHLMLREPRMRRAKIA